MTEKKKQELASRIVNELMMPEVQAMVEDARIAGRSEANEQIRLALFNLDEDDPVRANIARAREILLGVIGSEPAQDAGKAEVGDWVAVRFTGALSCREWHTMQWIPECEEPGWVEEVRIIERAAEVKRRIEDTTRG